VRVPALTRLKTWRRRPSFDDASVGSLLACDTLEHVYDTFAFLREAERILAPGGVAILVSVMYFPIHSYPYDYWRFTPEAFRRLACTIGEPLVLTQGPEDFPDTVIAVVRKGAAITEAERMRFTEAVRSVPAHIGRCDWKHPREKEVRRDLKKYRSHRKGLYRRTLRRLGIGADKAAVRRGGSSSFDPNLARWFYESGSWKKGSWMGVPILQLPTDLMVLQEIIYQVRPKTILETGTHQGGASLFFASMLQLLHGDEGRVITVEYNLEDSTRERIANHPLGSKITVIEGSSTDPGIVARVQQEVSDSETPVLVFLDSDHSYAHVLKEMDTYHSIVSPGSYMLVFDTVCRYLYDLPHGNAAWEKDNAYFSVEAFLDDHQEFETERKWEKYHVTFAPLGFLKRIG
jgi:cephalosporin hydroxylase